MRWAQANKNLEKLRYAAEFNFEEVLFAAS